MWDEEKKYFVRKGNIFFFKNDVRIIKVNKKNDIKKLKGFWRVYFKW